MTRNRRVRRQATLTAALLLVGAHASFAGSNRVWYRTFEIDGQTIFYREAGSPDAPTLLLPAKDACARPLDLLRKVEGGWKSLGATEESAC